MNHDGVEDPKPGTTQSMTMSRGTRAMAVTGLLVLAILLPSLVGESPVALGIVPLLPAPHLAIAVDVV